MIYDNCSKYIEQIVFKQIPVDNWKERCIIFPTYDLLSKTMICIFKSYGINNIKLFGQVSYTDKWSNVDILSLDDIASYISDAAVIVLTDLDSRDIVNKKIIGLYRNQTEMVDFSRIRMNKMPNVIESVLQECSSISLRDVQLKELRILKLFKQICEKYGLRYYLDYGTLLGAVRHKGFIPWDDDLDVAMPMQDYLKLCEVFPRDGEFFFDSIFNELVDDYTVSTLTKIKIKELIIEEHSFPVRMLTGIGMDIFPLCGYPSDKVAQKAYMDEFQVWADIWKERVVIPYGTKKYSKEEHKRIADKMLEISTRYDFDTAEYVAPAYFSHDTYVSEGGSRVMAKELYAGTIEMQFEDDTYFVPIGYDDVLKNWYGDYMVVPKEINTSQHSAAVRRVNNMDKIEYVWK